MKKIIVYGGKGWIGSQFCEILNNQEKDYISLNTRIDNYEAVENDIKKYDPSHIISFTGRTHGNINGKEYEILVFLVGHEQKSIGNNMFVDLLLIDTKGFLSIRVFKEKIDEKSINLKIGKTYVISLIHALGRDGRMRLRFKTIIEADKLKKSFFKHFMIYLDRIDFIDDIKEKLLELEEGSKKVLISYKDIKICCGLSISSEVNLQNIMSNIKGIKNIEKIM